MISEKNHFSILARFVPLEMETVSRTRNGNAKQGTGGKMEFTVFSFKQTSFTNVIKDFFKLNDDIFR